MATKELKQKKNFQCMICGNWTWQLWPDWQEQHLENPFHQLKYWFLKKFKDKGGGKI